MDACTSSTLLLHGAHEDPRAHISAAYYWQIALTPHDRSVDACMQRHAAECPTVLSCCKATRAVSSVLVLAPAI